MGTTWLERRLWNSTLNSREFLVSKQFKRLGGAMGLGLLLAQQVHALSPAETSANDTVKVYAATGESLREIGGQALANACATGTFDVFKYGDVADTWGSWVKQGLSGGFSCRLRSDLSGPFAALAGRKIAIFESAEEGASGALIQGTGAYAARPQLRFVNVFNGGCTSLPQPAGSIPSWRCTSLTWQVPHFGLSEVSPDRIEHSLNTFQGHDNPAGVELSSNDIERQAVFQRVFGIAVTPQLYRAMQQAQGLTQDDTAANRPQLSRVLAASLLSGNLGSGPDGQGWQHVVGSSHALAASQVNICRDRNGSGVQAVVNDQLLGLCGSHPTTVASADWSDTPNGRAGLGTAGRLQVVETEGENDLEWCMAEAQARGAFAIAAVSVGRRAEADHAGYYRFIKLDRVEPGLASARLGEGLMSDVHMVWNRAAAEAWPTDVRTVVQGLTAEIGRAEQLAQLGAVSLRSGVVAIPGVGDNVYLGGSASSQTHTGATATLTSSCAPRLVIAPR